MTSAGINERILSMAEDFEHRSGTLVIGLGRFGSAVATTMDSLGLAMKF